MLEIRTTLWATLISVSVFYTFKFIRWSWNHYQIRRCLHLYWQGRPHHWFWGHLRYLKESQKNPEKMIEYIKNATYDFPHGMGVFVGPIVTFLRVHHENVFKRFLGGSEKNFPKSNVQYNALKPWLGDKGLLILGGKEWHRHRRLLSNSFHFDILRSYAIKMNECSNDLVKKWLKKTKNESEISVEVFRDFSLMTIDVIMKCLMGVETRCQEEDSEHKAYVSNIYNISKLILKRFQTQNILLRFDSIFYLTNDGKDLLKSCKEVRDYSTKVIEHRKKEYADGATIGSKLGLNKNSERHYDFLDMLLQSQDTSGKLLTDVEISDEVNTFMFEGYDTTTSAISWLCYCLAKNQKCQEKCYTEIMEVFGTKTDLELGDLTKLKYLSLCVKESLRMYPPVASIVRKPTSNVVIDKKLIRKGTDVIISILGIHHNARLWPNPEIFDPLRFTVENSAKRNSYAYVPFSAGIRGCIGQNFAMNEMKICAAYVLRSFHLHVDDNMPVTGCLELIYRTKTGLHLLVKERNAE